MTTIGFNPNSALPSLVPGAQLAGSNPLLAAQGGAFPSTSQLAAQAGVGEKPGIVSRFMSAMRAAVSELRGQGASDAQIRSQVLAMQSQLPVTLAKEPVGTTPTRTAKKVRTAKTWKTLANPPKATAMPQAGAGNAAGVLPSNATQLPGATAYSYDAQGNPVSAPTMQQLGVNPTMLQGLTGMANAADPDNQQGPQMNATNQTSLGLGSGLGSQVPVLGQPIITAPTTSSGDTQSGSGTATQSVTNRNATDQHSQGLGYGGYGGWGDPTGGIATPYSPYGSSMTGAYTLGQKPGFFSRLFG